MPFIFLRFELFSLFEISPFRYALVEMTDTIANYKNRKNNRTNNMKIKFQKK